MKIAPIVLLLSVLMGMCLADPLFLFNDMFRQQRALMKIWARSQQHTAETLMGGLGGGGGGGGGGKKGGHHSSDSEHHGKLHHGRHHGKKPHLKKRKKGHKFMRIHNVLARLHRRGQTRRLQRLRDWGKWFG